QTGLGPGFSAFTFGCAISSNGAVLLARKRPVPESVELVQFRDGGTVWAASSIFATSTSSAQKSRHFHSDGDTAAVAGIASGVGASRLIVDFLGVDPVSGDWYVEDTGRGPNVLFGYGIGDVHVRGDQAIVQVFGSRRAFAWKRTAPGQWSDVALPDAVVGPSSDMWRLALGDDRLLSLHRAGDRWRFELRERTGPASWTLLGVTPLASVNSIGSVGLQFDGERALLQDNAETTIWCRTSAGTLSQEWAAPGFGYRLGDGYLVTRVLDGSGFETNVIPFDDLASGFPPCFSAGRNVCTEQRGGALRYLPGSGIVSDEVWLTGAPPNAFAVLYGQRSFNPPFNPTVDALCLPLFPTRVTTMPIRTSTDGSGIWRLDPSQLPTELGPISYAGELAAFQALVRIPGGAASTDAVWVQL
ncbi:MAG: hypothetical protein AAF726_24155, partial [Planctomycetota bacterium]